MIFPNEEHEGFHLWSPLWTVAQLSCILVVKSLFAFPWEQENKLFLHFWGESLIMFAESRSPKSLVIAHKVCPLQTTSHSVYLLSPTFLSTLHVSPTFWWWHLLRRKQILSLIGWLQSKRREEERKHPVNERDRMNKILILLATTQMPRPLFIWTKCWDYLLNFLENRTGSNGGCCLHM